MSTRRTEQALLQVINSAVKSLFITSFVAYDVSTIVNALNAANDRGVAISMLLELSQEHGGSITFDAIGKMRTLVPAANLYAWRDKADPFSRWPRPRQSCRRRLHDVFHHQCEPDRARHGEEHGGWGADSGGAVPKLLSDHLRYLSDMRLITAV